CFTMPVQIGGEHNLAAIGGRAFVTGADYRALIERLRAGDLKDLLVRDPFENVIFAEERRLEQLADRLAEVTRDFNSGTSEQQAIEQTNSTPAKSKATLESELEQLRGELDYRSHLAESLPHFLERISSPDP